MMWRILLCIGLLLLPARAGEAPPENRYFWLELGGSLEASGPGPLNKLAARALKEGQLWKFTKVSPGTYRITSALPGNLCLGLTAGKLSLVPAAAAPAWKVVYNGESMHLIDPATGQAVSQGDDGKPCLESTSDPPFWMALKQRLTSYGPPEPGNYLRNEGPVQGQGPCAGSLWVVVCDRLMGRARPAPQAPIQHKFPRATRLQADLGRGGSDDVFFNAVDDQGNTWMRVRTPQGESLNCWVRANSRYIKAVTP